MYYKVIDDFLPQDKISFFRQCILNEANWKYSDEVGKNKDKSGFYFYSILWEPVMSAKINETLLEQISIIPKKLQFQLLRSRACLYIKTNTIIEHAFHIDSEIEHLTGIFYLNSNNGYTRLKLDDRVLKIESKENRLLLLDGDLPHSSSTCTDNDIRLVLNFNFILP